MSVSRPRPCRPADNPFASHRVDSLPYRGLAVSWPDLAHHIDAIGGRAAIVGPKGSGKTTLLEEFARHLQRPVVLVRLPGSESRPHRTAIRQLPDPVTSDHTILIDSAEQLGALAWHHLVTRTRRARRLVATLHRPGRLPTLVECNTDPDLLRKLVRELAPNESATLDPTIEGLFNRHRGNIRSCLRDLYDVFAGRRGVETLEREPPAKFTIKGGAGPATTGERPLGVGAAPVPPDLDQAREVRIRRYISNFARGSR